MKERLRRYADLLREIDIEERRLEAQKSAAGYGAERARDAIGARLRRLREEEEAEHRALSELINGLPTPEQRQVLYARYFDGHAWAEVTAVVFGRRPDFLEKADSYARRVFRIHGGALAKLRTMESKKSKIKRAARVAPEQA